MPAQGRLIRRCVQEGQPEVPEVQKDMENGKENICQRRRVTVTSLKYNMTLVYFKQIRRIRRPKRFYNTAIVVRLGLASHRNHICIDRWKQRC